MPGEPYPQWVSDSKKCGITDKIVRSTLVIYVYIHNPEALKEVVEWNPYLDDFANLNIAQNTIKLGSLTPERMRMDEIIYRWDNAMIQTYIDLHWAWLEFTVDDNLSARQNYERVQAQLWERFLPRRK